MEYLALVMGMIIGILVSLFVRSLFIASGTLKIDHSDPEKDKYLFVIDGELDRLSKKKKIVLKVDNNADLSQK